MNRKKIYFKVSKVGGVNTCWADVRHLGSTQIFEKNQIIDVSDAGNFFYIHSGRVKVTYLERNGQEMTLLFAEAGSILNVVSQFVADSKPPLLTCLEKTEVVIFKGCLLTDKDFVSRHPEQTISLLTSMAVHLEIHSQQASDSSLLTSLSYLCRVFWDIYSQGGGKRVLDPDMTQQELADMLGVNRTTLTRSLHRLRELGVIGAYTKHRLVIDDPDRLRELSESQ